MYFLCSFIRDNISPTCREEMWSMARVLFPTMHFIPGMHGFRRKKLNVQKSALYCFVLLLPRRHFQNQHCGPYSLSPLLPIPSCTSGGCGPRQQAQLGLEECRHHRHWCQEQTQGTKQQQTTALWAQPNTAERSRITDTAPKWQTLTNGAAVQHGVKPRGEGGATWTIQFFRGLSVIGLRHRVREHWLQTICTISFLSLEATWYINLLVFVLGKTLSLPSCRNNHRLVLIPVATWNCHSGWAPLFVCKSPFFFLVLLFYQYCCCYSPFLIPLLFFFVSKSLSQPTVSALVPFSPEGCEGERERLI